MDQNIPPQKVKPDNVAQNSKTPSGRQYIAGDLEKLQLVEELEIFDSSIDLKIQTIGPSRSDIPVNRIANEYDDMLMKADLSKLGVDSDNIRRSGGVVDSETAKALEEVTFKTPEELKVLHPSQQKEAKLKILNDIRKRLSSEDEQERYEAIQQFSYYIDDNNLVILNKLVTDSSPYIKEYIIELVSKFRNNNSISILEVLKRDQDTNISSKALDALSLIDPRYARPITTVDKKAEKEQETNEDKKDKGSITSIFKKI
ncbi:MAG: hypothetical protein AB1782_13160 [Cyanobacteriota bacterium]